MSNMRNLVVFLVSVMIGVLSLPSTPTSQESQFCYGTEGILILLAAPEGKIEGVVKDNVLLITEGPMRGYSSIRGIFRPGSIIIIEKQGGAMLGGKHFNEKDIVRINLRNEYERAPVGTEICVEQDVQILGKTYGAGSRLVVTKDGTLAAIRKWWRPWK